MKQKTKELFQSFWGWWLVIVVLAGVVLVLVGWAALRPIRNYYLTFLRAAGITNQELMVQAQSGIDKIERWQTEDDFTFLLLGVDTSEYRSGEPVMTDSMMLANYNLAEKTLATLPLPRDIYLPDLEMKLNMIYNRALEAGSVTPEIAVRDYIAENLLEEQIDFALVFTFEQVVALIDMLDGIEVEVERSFIDEKYPRAGVDVSVEKDPAILYETIEFEEGKQKMNGATALKFMRSRYAVGPEGTDMARSARQQKVMQALIEKTMERFFDRRTLLNFSLLGQLYTFYMNNYERYLPLSDLIGMLGAAGVLEQKGETGELGFTIKSQELSVYANGNMEGILEEVGEEEQEQEYGGMWIWKVRDWGLLRQEMREKLGFNFDEIKKGGGVDE